MGVFARVKSLGLLGIDGFLVEVEADLSQGLPGFDVVGLPGRRCGNPAIGCARP